MDEKSPPSAEPGQNGTDGLPSQTGHPPQHQYNINIDSLSLVPSKTARNLGVIIGDQLTFTAHIACLQVVPLCAIQHPQNQTILIRSSTLVERATYHYQSRGVPLYLQEAFEDPTLQRAPHFQIGRAHV